MHKIGESQSINQKQIIQGSQYTQSAVLHRGQKYIPTRTDAEFAVAFTIPQQDVIQLFEEIASSLHFEMIQSQETYATAIKRPAKSSIFQFLNCLSWWGSHQHVHAIKLVILNSPKSTDPSLKLCRIKALSQSSLEVVNFIQNFKEKMEKIKGVVPSTYLFEPSSYNEQNSYQNSSNPFHLQACAFYMFHKILTSNSGPEQKIKNNIEKALKDFFQAFKNIEQSSQLLPTPLTNVMDISKQACQEISKLFLQKGQSSDSLSAIGPYMKISVEKYIFDRTQTVLKIMYLHKNRQTTQKFKRKKQKILSTLTKQQIFDQVLVNKNIRLIDASQNTDKNNKKGIGFCTISCPQLQKISLACSPREKIKHCQLMYANLKSYFYQKLKMKYELSSMEDIIPVFIVVVLFTQVQYLRSQLDIMIDFIHAANEDFQAEKRMLVNLSESYNYIVRDWKIQI